MTITLPLQCGLFFYDIFWVFGTEVMVSVATQFDAPIKLLFPRNIFDLPNSKMTMLGLGDIVIPGMDLLVPAGLSLAHTNRITPPPYKSQRVFLF